MFNSQKKQSNSTGFPKKHRRNILDVFMQDKHTKTMGVIMILAALLIGYLEVDYLIPEKVTVEYITMDGTEEFAVETRSKDVDALLDEMDIEVADIDRVAPFGEHEIDNGMTVSVTKCIESTAVIAGDKQEFILMPGTVEENLKLNEIKFDDDDIIKPALDKAVTAKTSIEVKDVEKKVKEKTEKVKPKSKVILDPSLHSGTIEETSGESGEAVYTYTTTYINGKKKDTKKEVKEWIKKPTDNVLRLGTSATGEKGEATVSKEFTAETTAYTAGPGARGSTGQLVHYGTCAVDPSVIPYGSLLYIEGYGTAIANDCGGAVKGYIVDLYMNSNSQCIQWGRRSKRAFIISR